MPPPDADVDAMTDAVLAASRLLVAISARSIASVDESITMPQFRLLVVLAGQGSSKLADLADALGVNPSTATRTVDRLIAAGMVTRSPNPSSRREIVLELTDSGQSLVRSVMSRRRAEISGIVTKLQPSRRRGLIEALTVFAEAGGEIPNAAGSDALWP